MRYKLPTLRRAVPWLAQLVMIALVFQVLALDHHFTQTTHPTDLVGIHGTSEHTAHCHGDTLGCAQASSIVSVLSQTAGAALPPSLTEQLVPLVSVSTPEPVLASIEQPPRSTA